MTHDHLPLSLRLGALYMRLRDILYVSYRLPVDVLRPLVPARLPLAQAGEGGLLSIVVFRCAGVRPALLPFPGLTYNQVTLRTYVKHPGTGEHGVYFIRSAVTSAAVAAGVRLARLNWEQAELVLRTERNGRSCYKSYTLGGDWEGEAYVRAEEVAPQTEATPPLEDTPQLASFITHVLLGFYGTEARLLRQRVWHPPLAPRPARVSSLRLAPLAGLGVLSEAEMERPHNVLLVPQAPFWALPPRRLWPSLGTSAY